MEPSITTRFTAAFNLRHPLACAGLAFSGTTPGLATAVAKAGAVGTLGAGIMPPPAVEAAVTGIRLETDGAINVNFITIYTQEAHIAICEQVRPKIVSFHWGHPPREWIDRLHKAGISVWEQIGSVDAAQIANDDGIDVIIAQGSEAGGHNFGTLPLFALLPLVVDAVAPTMVLAAGGITDGRGVAAALSLGADGVWVGTRLVATQEADIAPGYGQRLTEAQAEDAVLTSVYGQDQPHFNPFRVLNNDTIRAYTGRENEAPNDPTNQPLLGEMDVAGTPFPIHQFASLVPMSTARGDLDQMTLPAGQGVGLVNDLPPASDVIERMMADAASRLKALGKAAK
jgi:NAD(P)H-dependent flavin oxidoreductase YrpB (nitropropane dioxygenase family)